MRGTGGSVDGGTALGIWSRLHEVAPFLRLFGVNICKYLCALFISFVDGRSHTPKTMSLKTRPISVNVNDAFAPFSNSIATSLTRYLPLGVSANGLSLGGCDIRKVFYTIFAEGENGLIFHRRKLRGRS
jgi:hypothetical protein